MGNKITTMNERDPQPGDLIEIFQSGYQHWAVYIGDDYVVHLTVPTGGGVISSGSGPGLHNIKGIVLKDTLKDAVQDCKWKINNLLEDKYIPRDAYVIVKKALSLVGTKHQYNLLGKNCEHFATKLRYGQGESRQVKVGGIAVGVSSTVLLLGGVAASVFAVVKNLH